MNKRAIEFQKEIERHERQLLRDRRAHMKAQGYTSEKDYFTYGGLFGVTYQEMLDKKLYLKK